MIIMIVVYLTWAFLAVLCLTVVLCHRKRKAHYGSLSKFPGTPPTFLIGNLSSYIRMHARAKSQNIDPQVYITEHLMAEAVKYEETGMHCTWFGPVPGVIIYKAEIVESVLRSSNSIEKSFYYTFVHEWIGTGLLTSTGDKWKSRRKLLTPSFHFRILEDFFQVFNEHSFELVEKLKTHLDEPFIDIKPLMSLCSLDMICGTIMGVSIGAQKGNSREYIQATHDLGAIVRYRISTPWLWPDFLFGLTERGKKFNRLSKIVHNFTDKVIKEKKEKCLPDSNLCQTNEENGQPKKRKTFLDLLLDMNVNGQLLSDEDIREEVDTFMFEGHDTTATALTFALYCIGLYPDVQEKIHEELNEIFGEDTDRPVNLEDTKKMKYLECALKESLRLYPPVPIIGRKLREDITIGDFKIPRDTTISVRVLALHRNSKVFPNPERYDPGRFLPENSAGRHPYAFIPFSAGRRNCIGQKFAMLEIKTVVSNILRYFKVASLDSRGTFRIKADVGLRPAQEVRLKFLKKI